MSASPTPNPQPERSPVWLWIGVAAFIMLLAGMFFVMASSRLTHDMYQPKQEPADRGPVEPH